MVAGLENQFVVFLRVAVLHMFYCMFHNPLRAVIVILWGIMFMCWSDTSSIAIHRVCEHWRLGGDCAYAQALLSHPSSYIVSSEAKCAFWSETSSKAIHKSLRAMRVLTTLRVWVGLSEPLLLAYAISINMSGASSNNLFKTDFY